MVCQIPSFWFGSYTNFYTHKFLCAKSANNVLQTIMAACTALLPDTKLSRLQINIIVNDDQLCLRIDLKIAGHFLDRTTA